VNGVAAQNPPQDEQGNWGPCMLALANDKQRHFVSALFEAPRKKGRLIWAARAAGYGSTNSSNDSIAAIASRLHADQRIQAAIAEESHRQLRGLAPGAIAALERLIDDPAAKDHARAIATVLDRSDPLMTTHTVKVERDDRPTPQAIDKVLARIEALAARAGLALPAPKLIEGECVELGQGRAST